MKKDQNEVVDIFEGKITVEERLMLLLTGIFCFPVGFALYFYFEKKKDFVYHCQFAKTGAWYGFGMFLLLLISILLFALAG